MGTDEEKRNIILSLIIVTTMGIKSSPSGESFRFFSYGCDLKLSKNVATGLLWQIMREKNEIVWKWVPFQKCRNCSNVNFFIVSEGLQSVAHEIPANLSASADSSSVIKC
jgi:hypothetical protein